MTNELTTLREAMTPQSFDQAVSFAQMVSKTQFVPAAFRGKPDDCLAAITYGAELGLSPMQALRGVAVINGAPAVYGDTLLAICQTHPQWSGKEEWIDGEGTGRTAHCVVKRRGESDVHATFSASDAKAAGLWGKQGPWSQYSDRMLKMRARSFALRDQFADALRGVVSAEEAGDYQRVGPDHAKDVTPAKPQQPLAAPEYVALYDAWGAEYQLLPGEVEQWIKDAIDGATVDELGALVSNNPSRRDVGTAVAEAAIAQDRRGAPAPAHQAAEPAAPAVAPPSAGKTASLKERCEAIAEVYRSSQTVKALTGHAERFEAEIAAMPAKAKTKLKDIFFERFNELPKPPEPTVAPPREIPGETFDDDIAHLEPDEWKNVEGRVEDSHQQELLG